MINPDPDPEIIRQLEIRNAGHHTPALVAESWVTIIHGNTGLIPFIRSDSSLMVIRPIISIKIYNE